MFPAISMLISLRPNIKKLKLFIFFFLVILLFNSNVNATLESNKTNSLLEKTLTNHVNSKHTRLSYLRHKKRCHYTDKPTGVESSSQASFLIDESKITYNLVKQPRVRDQNRHYLNHHQSSKNGLMDQTETEQLYVNIGETINLTCNIDTREIDWHFKDRNLTTTILSYGLQLQVAPQQHQHQLQYDFTDVKFNDYDDTNNRLETQPQLVKYRVSSDRQSNHMLTLHVQGTQDEGSYQCVDSKSEIPIKKTIRVILRNNSAALTSGFSGPKYSYIIFLSILASFIFK